MFKKGAVTLAAFLTLAATYVAAKNLGLIGRLFSDGLNASETFPLFQVGDAFQLKLEPNWRGTYRYNAILKFGDKSTPEGNKSQSASFKIKETLCDTGKLLGVEDIELEADSKKYTHFSLGRYGKEIRLPLGQKRLAVCLNVSVENLSEPVVQTAALNIYAVNTRPCWFVECLLD
ncbi:hypothetical protein [Litorimonas sp. WD9-15]|uniref:hypothetical protein n=1 Tax=Litorimonas sp. WD9-15 TaxID=3418716 RepID=UPI003CFCD423